MNKVILMGRLTREPDVRYSQNSDGSMAVARYTLAVDRRRARTNSDGAEQTADFISCVAFGRQGRICDGVFDRVFDLERSSFGRNIEALFGEYDFRLCIRCDGIVVVTPGKERGTQNPPPKIINNHTNLKYFIV